MKIHDKIVIDWEMYRPSIEMQTAINSVNQHTLSELHSLMPSPEMYRSPRVSFDYRIYSNYELSKVEKVYIHLNGFAERANTPDTGIKGLLTDELLKQTDNQKYALLVISGLFSFPMKERNTFLKRGFGSLTVIADELAQFIHSRFAAVRVVTVAGYSLGGVLSPLTASAIVGRRVAEVDQVCCGEPNFALRSITPRQLLRLVSKASAYRNEQIKATDVHSYIAVKKTPSSSLAMISYRAKQYRPLIRHAASMRFIARDLALQAGEYPAETAAIQFQNALSYLIRKGVRINMLRAEHSVLCNKEAYFRLMDNLMRENARAVHLFIIKGDKADHGIEEQRSLSTPFLVKPDIYSLQSTGEGITHERYSR